MGSRCRIGGVGREGKGRWAAGAGAEGRPATGGEERRGGIEVKERRVMA